MLYLSIWLDDINRTKYFTRGGFYIKVWFILPWTIKYFITYYAQLQISSVTTLTRYLAYKCVYAYNLSKAVLLHAMKALWVTAGIAPTLS
jgi:hypothetical protein